MQSRLDAAAGEHAETAKERAVGQVDNLADAAEAVASSLSEHHHEGLAEYARRMSRELSTMAGHLQSRSIDDLVHDARDLARSNPSMFLFGSVAIGFGLARFLKASETNESRDAPMRGQRFDRGIRPQGQESYDEQQRRAEQSQRDAQESSTAPWEETAASQTPGHQPFPDESASEPDVVGTTTIRTRYPDE